MKLLSQNSKLGKQQYYSTKKYIIYDICDFKLYSLRSRETINTKFKIRFTSFFLFYF